MSDLLQKTQKQVRPPTTPTAIAADTQSGYFVKLNKAKEAAYKKFQHAKTQCLYGHKRDKSSVGQFDHGVVEICNLINDNFPEYYTTSSCAGRCFMYTGMGIKSTNTFYRCRISHIAITDPKRYFNLQTLLDDPTGGGDVIPQVYDGGKRQRQQVRRQQQTERDTLTVTASVEANDDDVGNHDDYSGGGMDEEDTHVESNQNDLPVVDGRGVNEVIGLPLETNTNDTTRGYDDDMENEITVKKVWWIRYEPFIFHVACRSLQSAIRFMNIARPIFKTVGITSLSHATDAAVGDGIGGNTTVHSGCPKYVVAIHGDEGLDMPLTNEHGVTMINDMDDNSGYTSHWLASLVNERHVRNSSKIDRLVQAIHDALDTNTNDDEDDEYNMQYHNEHHEYTTDTNALLNFHEYDDYNVKPAMFVVMNGQQIRVPRSYDVIGDVAILHTLPVDTTGSVPYNHDDDVAGDDDNDDDDDQLRTAIGEAIIQRNKSIKVVVLRSSNLDGNERAPGINGIQILTGPSDRIQRIPLITTHREYGISCIVNIHHTFFSPRMGQERIRICEQIGKQLEDVLILFAGVCMDAFLIAARTNASSVTAIESNEFAIECAQKGLLLLERNKQCQHNNAAQRLQIIHGDCLQIVPTLRQNHYHRIIAPRPKEGNLDGDQPPQQYQTDDTLLDDNRIGGSGGKEFLIALLSVLQSDGGTCHWYDFCADHEYPQCLRTVHFLSDVCKSEYQYRIEIIHIAHVGSIAKRQLRICVDFRVFPCLV